MRKDTNATYFTTLPMQQ